MKELEAQIEPEEMTMEELMQDDGKEIEEESASTALRADIVHISDLCNMSLVACLADKMRNMDPYARKVS